MTDLVFILAAAVAVLSGIAIVSRKNPVYSVVFMLPFFLAMTTLFVLLDATFLAAIQMIVYGGAILVVFLFVIMLINLRPEELRDDFKLSSYFWATFGAGLLVGVLALFVSRGVSPQMETAFTQKEIAERAEPDGKPTAFGTAENIAQPLFVKQMVPFELASILITVATLGAVLLSKKKV